MPALPGWRETGIRRGPGEGDATHKNGVGELPGGKELGRSDPRSQKLAPRSEFSALMSFDELLSCRLTAF